MKTISYDETKYVLVPKEPIEAMINAAYECCDGYNNEYYVDLYKAMIAAAPKHDGGV